MAVQIGQKPEHSFSEPLGLLTDCHRRIERFLNVLVRVAGEVRGAEMNPEQKQAFASALQYFRDAAPKHTADEERSLFPRLRAAGGPEAEEALGHVDRLEADHLRADRFHHEVDELGCAWLRNGCLPKQSSDRLYTLTRKLQEIYRAHIELEDTHVFPLAARALSRDDQQAIGREMAARRNVFVGPVR
jgi:hemerythrin-like domain-containing protein